MSLPQHRDSIDRIHACSSTAVKAGLNDSRLYASSFITGRRRCSAQLHAMSAQQQQQQARLFLPAQRSLYQQQQQTLFPLLQRGVCTHPSPRQAVAAGCR